jgi:hypothetical protein
MRMIGAIAIAMVELLPVSSRAQGADENMRCGQRVIAVGETMYDVQTKCGEPTQRIQRGGGSKGRWANIEEWTYDFGSKRFVRVLTFNNGRLVYVETTSNYGR